MTDLLSLGEPPSAGGFISYAKNFEDVILWHALSYLGRGFYIDVGAGSPLAGSVTKALYERGWSGVNIEPQPAFYEALKADRPRDAHLQEMPSLGAIFAQHAPSEVHILRINMAGMESRILEGMELAQFRPWVVVVKTMASLQQRARGEPWEVSLQRQGYRSVHFDGANHYFLAAERSALAIAFSLPSDATDRFTCWETEYWRRHDLASKQVIAKLQRESCALRGDLAATHAALEASQAEVIALQQSLSASQAEVIALRQSWSWRLTQPLRQINKRAQGLLLRWRSGAPKAHG